MYPIKNQQMQNNMPPLPPATLVIDMRGEGEDVINMLEIEIRNLTEEMKQQKIRLWSSLIDIISFKAIEPLADDDIIKLSSSNQSQNSSTPVAPLPGDTTSHRLHKNSLTGVADQLDAAHSFPPQYQSSNQDDTDEDMDDMPTPYADFAYLIEEIDRLRNIRINAVSNLGPDGTVGRNVKEPSVRVIFLADARHANSLQSTAACAWYLKKYYSRLERTTEQPGQQLPINIAVLCLNHLNTDQKLAPTRLIQGLRWEESWDHLDALILSEKYREDIGRVDNETQNLLAELLLYVLLIVSPVLIRPSAPRGFEEEDEEVDGQRVSLPPNTFLVGLSSIENSTRWGYQLLNCGLAEQALHILMDGNPSNEQATVGPAIETWLYELRGRVRNALPDRLPQDVSAVHALTLATKAASPAQGVFSNSQLSLTLGDRSIRELENYLNTLTATYALSNLDQDSSSGFSAASAPSPTLQDALLSIPRIENALDQWEGGEPETPLVQAQLEAHRVLGHTRLLQGPRGAIPRAKVQLKELANTTAALQGKLAQNSIDVRARQQALQKSGQDRIDDLKKHGQKWPLFAASLNFKTPLAWATTILAFLLCSALVILGFAVLGQLFESFNPDLVHWLSQPLFGEFTTFFLALALTLLFLLLVVGFSIGRWLLNEKRSPLQIEVLFAIGLLAVAFTCLLAWWSYALVTTPLGLTILGWIPPGLRSWIGLLAFFLFLVIVIVEIFYYFWWRKEMEREREAVAADIRAAHQRNVDDITSHIVDRLTLHLLTSAGLGDEKTKNSAYYRRVDDLSRLLTNAYTYVRDERRLAEGRLGSNLNEASLRIRQELLDVAALKRGYKRLGAAMAHNRSELRELTEILLRSMGQEMPHHIERQFKEKAPPTNREAYYTQILMEALVAVTLRFSTSIPASDMLTPLEERYSELDGQSTSQLSSLRVLVDALNKKIKTADLDENDSVTTPAPAMQLDIPLAGRAMSAWGQMLWEGKDMELAAVLASGGVVAKLMNKGYTPQTVKETLGIRTNPSGRSLITRLAGDLYLFVSPSPESRKFLRDFLPDRFIADFPDSERLLLLQIQHYVARPLVKQLSETSSGAQQTVVSSLPDDDDALDASANATNGVSPAHTTGTVGGTTVAGN